jgi:hypothetical protein
MTIARSFLDQFKLTDWTPSLLVVPNKFGVINESGLFAEESVSQNTLTFEEITTTNGVIVDRVRGERNTQSRDASRRIRAYSVPHFPFDDYVTPADVQGQRAYGSPDQAETLQAVMTRKLERIARSHDELLEASRSKLLTTGTFYAPNNTVDNSTTLWAEFGISQKVVNFDLSTPAVNPMAKLEEITAHMLDNAQGATVQGIRGYASPEFFQKLIDHAKVVNAFQYFSSSQDPLRTRVGGMSFRRTFTYGNVEFIEVRDSVHGVRQIPAGDCVFVPVGTDIFSTTFAPAATFSAANTLGEKRYLTSKVIDDIKVVLQSESNFLHFCNRPQLICRGWTA